MIRRHKGGWVEYGENEMFSRLDRPHHNPEPVLIPLYADRSSIEQTTEPTGTDQHGRQRP